MCKKHYGFLSFLTINIFFIFYIYIKYMSFLAKNKANKPVKTPKVATSSGFGDTYISTSSANVRMYHLTETDPTSEWIHYKSGSSNGVFFTLLSKNPEGSNNVLSGNIKIQCINGQDETREYAICDMIKNTSDLATVFYFTSSHMGKTGIECNMPKNCCFRLKLEPNSGDDIYIEVVMNY